MADSLTDILRDHALSLGFSLMGVAPANDLSQDELAMLRWLDEGKHGDMAYLARDPCRRTRPERVLPGVKSIIVLAMNYFQNEEDERTGGPPKGRIARYAWGEDYHGVNEERLKSFEDFIRSKTGPETTLKSYVDHGPVLEKAVGRESGIGFIGKNTLLITEEFGSWVFLSVILTNLILDYGHPRTSQCGSCRLCVDACPTDALTVPYVLDARRCISYLTIENKGEIPEGLKPLIDDWVFGCDICQEVCPFNADPVPTRVVEFLPERGMGPTLDLNEVMSDNEADRLTRQIRKTPLTRAKTTGIRRNVEVVLSNLARSKSQKTEP